MKKVVYTLLIPAFAVFFYGCKKDNKEENTSILGKWTLTEVKHVRESNGTSAPVDEGDYEKTLEFKANNQYKEIYNDDYELTGTYQLSDNDKRLTVIYTGTDLNGDGIIDQNDIGEEEFEIKKLSSTTLELYKEENYENDYDGIVKEKFTYIYSRN